MMRYDDKLRAIYKASTGSDNFKNELGIHAEFCDKDDTLVFCKIDRGFYNSRTKVIESDWVDCLYFNNYELILSEFMIYDMSLKFYTEQYISEGFHKVIDTLYEKVKFKLEMEAELDHKKEGKRRTKI